MSSPELSNNPFINDPSNPHNRFPDLNTIQGTSNTGYPPASYGFNPQVSYPSPNTNIPLYQPQQQQQFYTSQSPNQYASVGYNSTPVISQPTGYQPNGYQPPVYGQSPYQQQQQYTGYPTSQISNYAGYPTQQLQPQQTAYLAEFDPYANRNPQTPGAYSSAQSYNQDQVQNATSATGIRTHPRDFIRAHKAELEMWDPASWKQLFNCFDELRSHWEGRKEQIASQIRQGGYYLSPQDSFRLQEVQKETERNIDSVAASFFQLKEVHAGYRQSGDLPSKNRVRESVNAAVQGLPEYPS